MRVLLDECLPLDLALEFVGHEAMTVADMEWLGTKNGALLKKTTEAGFEAFVTLDKNIEYQHNIAKLSFGIIVLHAQLSSLEATKACIPACLRILPTVQPGRVYHCGAG